MDNTAEILVEDKEKLLINNESITFKAKLAVIVAALGYFVDAFDLVLFNIIRVQSLLELGLTQAEILTKGAYIINMQMAGMLLGGFFWGILGDKIGRVKVLYGSIIIYSLATLINAFIYNVELYAWIRFIAGIGLAGEIGAGITLVSELLPKHIRGYGTTIVASTGIFGCVMAALFAEFFNWRTCYIIGGVMGLGLLFLRVVTHESPMFQKSKKNIAIKNGRLRDVFLHPKRLSRYLACVALGLPLYMCNIIFSTFAPEVGVALGISEPIEVSKIFLYSGIAMVIGDIASGILSQKIKSRKKILYIFSISLALILTSLLIYPPSTAFGYYVHMTIAWFFVGYWAVLLTTSAELFGTNIRATVATSIPNVIRATTIPLTMAFTFLVANTSPLNAVYIIFATVMFFTMLGLFGIRETYGRDLDFVEN
jgi:MFS family permease